MLKKVLAVSLAFVILVVTGMAARPAQVFAQGVNLRFEIGNAYYTVNDVPRLSVDGIPPYIDPAHDRTMVPLRTVAEALGAQVGWISDARTVTIHRGAILLNLPIDSALPGGMGMPSIVAGRTFVPLAYVSRELGAVVHWDSAARAVYVSDEQQPGVAPTPAPTPTPEATPTPTPTPEPSPTPEPTPTPGQISLYQFEQRILALTNEERRRYHLPYLELDRDLARAARSHSNDMARYDFFSHTGSDGSTVRTRVERYSNEDWGRVAENLSRGTNITPERTIREWMDSTGHRNNILDPNATHVGVGVAQLEGASIYVTLTFGEIVRIVPSPLPAPVPSPYPTPLEPMPYPTPYPIPPEPMPMPTPPYVTENGEEE